MRTLVVGAGATGGYLAALLSAGGRDVTLLVRDTTRGVALRDGSTVTGVQIPSLTRDQLSFPFDIVVLAVRSDAVADTIGDIMPAVAEHTRVLALTNGLRHIDCLTQAFGDVRTVGAAARMATSLASDGIVDVISPGVELQLGTLDDAPPESLSPLVSEFTVPGVDVGVVDHIRDALWVKFMFITSTAVLTCLARGAIGDVVSAPGGPAVAERILREVGAVAAADGGPDIPAALRDTLTDPASRFGPSMYRDLMAGRSVEVAVVRELAQRAERHGIDTPVLTAAVVGLEVHNSRIGRGSFSDCRTGFAEAPDQRVR